MSPGSTTRLDTPPTRVVDHAPPGYEILGLLGRGGMGVVYRARQVALGREVLRESDDFRELARGVR